MKKRVKEFRGKTIVDLKKETQLLREEIAKKTLQNRMNPEKNTNTIFQLRKKLAVLLTVLSEKEEIEKLKPEKKLAPPAGRLKIDQK
ncbi:50S ribosomal protein L29 [Candidatus Roizmanbacteria bacterium RIFCSPHIGHO2_01_FULL_39_8]|uniref:Large ribosomal subunit protein uL29 n=3 Tax=Candidatus Roizmaniibacteriota TaxID=1752723 RepID=A0A1F7GNN9_9BACT|nr:MAG: 50S ribosomal protein L29 [Candidatus Roizmanbacteria bacterium RIFCSPHIGHO2_01_FULL_39_8]OGK28163.1 MAG: 50S ribosomal protein L29 [Candidatus Roizmanbacteria bacterium RIFCSPHIGHO2_02_FULL_39_9]OGK37568.1 MAG: 50S ribosomal protein L29 [Candidatus Roizmanbacteria bacterium RIFCSPHIGHO2_12_FULL_39_8]